MEVISLKCPKCGAVLTVPDIYVGRTSKCGRCRHDILIVLPSEQNFATVGRRGRTTDWYNVLMNVALAALLLVLLGILARYVL